MSARVNLIHCPLCSLRMSKFYCVDCVISGHFIPSRSDLCYETFFEKSIRLFALKKEILETKNEIEDKNKIVWRTESIREEIELSKIRTKYLRESVKKNMIKKSQNLDLLSRALPPRHFNPDSSNISPVKASKDQLEADVCAKKEHLKETKIELDKVKSKFIQSLQSNIFPLEIFQKITSSSNLLLSPMMEAMETSYSQEEWVTMDTSIYSENRMVPSAIQNVEHVQTSNSLACQFTNIIADILGRHLPAKVSLQDLDKDNLAKNEAKLNRNVISLCMLLGVDQSSVRDDHIFHNIKQVILTIKEGAHVTDNDDIVVADARNNIYVDNIFSDSDEDWENVMNEKVDQDWENLEEPVDEYWEGLEYEMKTNQP